MQYLTFWWPCRTDVSHARLGRGEVWLCLRGIVLLKCLICLEIEQLVGWKVFLKWFGCLKTDNLLTTHTAHWIVDDPTASHVWWFVMFAAGFLFGFFCFVKSQIWIWKMFEVLPTHHVNQKKIVFMIFTAYHFFIFFFYFRHIDDLNSSCTWPALIGHNFF